MFRVACSSCIDQAQEVGKRLSCQGGLIYKFLNIVEVADVASKFLAALQLRSKSRQVGKGYARESPVDLLRNKHPFPFYIYASDMLLLRKV